MTFVISKTPAAIVRMLALLVVTAGHFQPQDTRPAAVESQTATQSRPRAEFIKIATTSSRQSNAKKYLEELCTTIGPRLTGSAQCTRACEWAKSQFEAMGLTATIEPWGEFDTGFERGVQSGRIVKPVEMQLSAVGTAAWSVGTDGPSVGPVREMPAGADEVTSRPEHYKNAWILRKSAGTRRGNDTPEEITKALEAAGIHGYVRGSRNELIHTSGNFRTKFNEWKKTPSIQITASDYKKINELLQKSGVSLEFNIKNTFSKGPVAVSNVIADITGTEFPDEYVVVGGHLDSWDGAVGATDNATGVATTLEAARLILASGLKPRRTIRFMLWTGEEQGLLGSRAYLKKHADLVPKISCALVHDEGTNYCGGLQVTPALRAILEPALGSLASLNPDFKFKFYDVKKLPMGIGSDHDSFLQAGVPGFFWVQVGDVNYDRQHHTQFDHLDVVRHDYQQHSSIVIACTAYAIACLDNLLTLNGR